jgi:hypothetical protein
MYFAPPFHCVTPSQGENPAQSIAQCARVPMWSPAGNVLTNKLFGVQLGDGYGRCECVCSLRAYVYVSGEEKRSAI